MLAGLLVLLAVLLAWWLRLLRRQRRIRRAIRAELARIRQDFVDTADRPRLAAQLSQLLRRAVRQRGGDSQLRGPVWHEQLQRIAPGWIDADQAAVLERAPYQRSAEFDADALLRACDGWLHAALEKRNLRDQESPDRNSPPRAQYSAQA